MKKRGMTETYLVAILIAIITGVVLLTIFWPKLSALTLGTGKQAECNWNLFLSAMTKQVSLGFAEIPLGCQAEYLTVNSEKLSESHSLAKKRITKYHADTSGTYAEASKAFPVDSNGNPSYDAMNEWALDRFMAKETAKCWNKVWHGKLDIVSRNWFEKRTVCIVCSVVSFSDDIPVKLKAEPVKSLYAWSNAEPYLKTTYYDYVAQDLEFQPGQGDMTFSTQVPQAVVYIESKYSTVWTALPYIGAVGAFAGVPFAIGLAGVAVPAGIIGTVVLNAVSYGSAGAVAASTAGVQSLMQKDPAEFKKMQDAVKEGEIQAIGLAAYEGLNKICTDIIA